MSEVEKILGVAFDLDGTLFNTENIYDLVVEKMVTGRGHALRADVISRMMGRPSHVALQILIESYELADSIPDLQQEAKRLFIELLPGRVAMMPGAREMIDLVQSLGLPRSITTSSEPQLVTPLLRMADIEQKFNFVLTSADVKNHKPHPEIYLSAARRFGIEPNQLLVFEDSQVGCAAAVAAGAITIALPSKHKDQHDFGGAALVADSLEDASVRRFVDLRIR